MGAGDGVARGLYRSVVALGTGALFGWHQDSAGRHWLSLLPQIDINWKVDVANRYSTMTSVYANRTSLAWSQHVICSMHY